MSFLDPVDSEEVTSGPTLTYSLLESKPMGKRLKNWPINGVSRTSLVRVLQPEAVKNQLTSSSRLIGAKYRGWGRIFKWVIKSL